MRFIRHLLVLLSCLALGGLATASLAGAASPAPASPAAIADALSTGASDAPVDPALLHRERDVNQALGSGDAQAVAPDATVSGMTRAKCKRIRNRQRRKRCLRNLRPKKMTIPLAKAVAMDVAEYVYSDPNANWSGYDAGSCKRLARTSVRCVFIVWEDIFSEQNGSYLDSIVCGDYVTSSYNRRNKLKVKVGNDPACFLASEL